MTVPSSTPDPPGGKSAPPAKDTPDPLAGKPSPPEERTDTGAADGDSTGEG